MKASDNLEQAWQLSGADAGPGSGYYTRRITGIDPLKLYAGIELPGRSRMISLDMLENELADCDLDQDTRGYVVVVEKQNHEHPERASVIIKEIVGAAPRDLFLILCADIIDHLRTSRTAWHAAQALNKRLAHWRLFFKATQEQGFTRERYVGLYAELEFLERCLDADIAPDDLSKGWEGPLGANHDFNFGRIAVEVKATTGNDADVTRIANIRQLDDTGLDALYLAHCAYDLREGKGRTLLQLVEQLKNRLEAKPVALAAFDERLTFFGFNPDALGTLTNFGFTPRRRQYFRVSEGFPRIVETLLPAGISDVVYSIHLSAAGLWVVDEQIVINLLPRRGHHG